MLRIASDRFLQVKISDSRRGCARESVLGEMMSSTISTSNLAVFNLENLVLDDDKRNEVLDLIAEHKKSMLALSIRLTNILERAKEAENGSN